MNADTSLPAVDYEPRDAPPGRVLLVGAGVAAGVLLTLAVSAALYVAHARAAPRPGDGGRQTSFRDSPHAQTDIAADWARQDAEVRRHLLTYGWVDRDAGVVRVPIERAMDLLVEEAADQTGGNAP